MNKTSLLAIAAFALAFTGCASQTDQSKQNYEFATQSLLEQLPNDADRSQPGRQLDLMPQGRYLTIGGEVVPIPRALVDNQQNDELFLPTRDIEDIEQADEPEPIRIRVIDGK